MKTHLLYYRKLCCFILVLSIAPGASVAVQNQPGGGPPQRKKFDLTIDNIMRGPNLLGYEPREIRWSADSKRVYFRWKRSGDPRQNDFDTYVVNRDGSDLKKLTEEEAKKAGTAEASKRPGYAEKMYEVKTKEVKDLDSYTYTVGTVCPPDYPDDLGSNFELTAYVFALESEFPKEPKVKDPCGLKGEFSADFLNKTEGGAPLGVKMEGSGITRSGKFVQFTHYDKAKKENCFTEAACAETKSGKCAEAGRTVAVDKSLIPLGTELLIEDIGPRTAEDTGKRIKGKHIDVYYGAIPSAEANKKSFTNKRVCKKKSKK